MGWDSPVYLLYASGMPARPVAQLFVVGHADGMVSWRLKVRISCEDNYLFLREFRGGFFLRSLPFFFLSESIEKTRSNDI